MLKFIYEQEPYYYDHAGGQAYDIKTQITMNEDASLTDIIEAMARLAKYAGYYATKQSFLNAIEDVFGDDNKY